MENDSPNILNENPLEHDTVQDADIVAKVLNRRVPPDVEDKDESPRKEQRRGMRQKTRLNNDTPWLHVENPAIWEGSIGD